MLPTFLIKQSSTFEDFFFSGVGFSILVLTVDTTFLKDRLFSALIDGFGVTTFFGDLRFIDDSLGDADGDASITLIFLGDLRRGDCVGDDASATFGFMALAFGRPSRFYILHEG